MAGKLTLRVITPSRIVLDKEVELVRVPGVDGSLAFLPRHADLVVALDSGQLSWREGGQEQRLFVSGGFAEVRDSTVRVVSEAGERPEEIDEERARAAEARARERLAGPRTAELPIDLLRAQLALSRALWRLRVRSGTGESA